MDRKFQITLERKEYLLDIEQAKKLNLLKEKDDRVRSWKEFKEKYRYKYGYFYGVKKNTVLKTSAPLAIWDQLTPHEATAIAAFSKLLKLRRDWIGEWEPDWKEYSDKFILYKAENEVRICNVFTTSGGLSFPTYQMAKEFLETFRDLIEEAKILI